MLEVLINSHSSTLRFDKRNYEVEMCFNRLFSASIILICRTLWILRLRE